MATEEKAVEMMGLDDGENEEEASEEANSEDVVSDGEVSKGDVKEDEEGQIVTQGAATNKEVAEELISTK